MKYLIAGLGNIDDEYKGTRHNIGFRVLDTLAKKEDLKFELQRYAYTAEYKFKGRTLLLIKPTTYMNLSGKSVNYWLQKAKIPIENLLIIVDDIALPFGTIRIRAKGGAAGHNGLEHINQTVGHQKYARLRFGIGNDFRQGAQVDYVLGKWSTEEREKLPERIDKTIEAVKAFTTIGLSRTMNEFNNK